VLWCLAELGLKEGKDFERIDAERLDYPIPKTTIDKTHWFVPKEYQEIVKAASIQANMECLAIYDTENPIALKRMIEGGTKLKAFSSEIMTAAQQQAFAIYEENASKDATFKTVYEQWKKFRESIYPWSAVSELAYGNFTMAPALQSITGKS
jgi:TRAP-type mannitol/chloroaromatic compound transport system substrate-binding protein